MPKASKPRQTIVVNEEVSGFASADRPTSAHHKIMARYASPLLGGPPRSDDLLAFVCHMYSEEEAELVQHLPIFRPRAAEKIARASRRPLADVKRVMDHLALEKKVILASGSPRRYTILPVMPGTFEMALMTNNLETRTAWHRRFAEIFERLWDSEFLRAYNGSSAAPVRYLPVQKLAPSLQHAWPSDRLEEILDHYDDFGITHCQCRQAMDLTGRGCGRPMENCAGFGPLVQPMVERGMMRRVDRAEMIAIKRDAEENGCVTFVMNVGTGPRGNGSCSCCGCCCHALRGISELSVPGLISRPHFLPRREETLCKFCGSCVKACPMGAWTQYGPRLHFAPERCIGCGLCVVACKTGALELAPNRDARVPEKSHVELLLKTAPGYVRNSVQVFVSRLIGRVID